jgi:hypothetical protein
MVDLRYNLRIRLEILREKYILKTKGPESNEVTPVNMPDMFILEEM